MKIIFDQITFDPADIADLSPFAQSALTTDGDAPEVALTKQVNLFLADKKRRYSATVTDAFLAANPQAQAAAVAALNLDASTLKPIDPNIAQPATP